MLLSRLHEILAQRQLNALFQPVANMPGQYRSHHQIATAAAEAKKQAKKIPGNNLFVDRRQQSMCRVDS